MKIHIPDDFSKCYLTRNLISDNAREYIGSGFIVKAKRRINTNSLYYSLSYVVSGAGSYTEESGKEYKLSPGILFHRFPGKVHSTRKTKDTPWREFCLVFSSGIYEMLCKTGMIDMQRPVEKIGLSQIWVDSFMEIIAALGDTRQDQLPLLLVKMLDLHQNLVLKARGVFKTLNEEMINETLLYLNSTPQMHIDFKVFCQQHGWGV